MKAVIALMAAFALLVAAGCGGDEERVQIFVVDGYRSTLGMRGRLVAVDRRPSYAGLGRLVAEVIRGPTREERDERGLITGFPRDVRLVGVARNGPTARVELASRTDPRLWPSAFYASAQLVYTLTELDGLAAVRLVVNDRLCCVEDMRGRPWREPLTRRLFTGWQGAPRE